MFSYLRNISLLIVPFLMLQHDMACFPLFFLWLYGLWSLRITVIEVLKSLCCNCEQMHLHIHNYEPDVHVVVTNVIDLLQSRLLRTVTKAIRYKKNLLFISCAILPHTGQYPTVPVTPEINAKSYIYNVLRVKFWVIIVKGPKHYLVSWFGNQNEKSRCFKV